MDNPQKLATLGTQNNMRWTPLCAYKHKLRK